jgi:predicted DNA-binding transcriptional regulator AlpA
VQGVGSALDHAVLKHLKDCLMHSSENNPALVAPNEPGQAKSKEKKPTGVSPALLNVAQAAAVFDVSERKFHVLRNEPWMPQPIVLGPRLLRWSAEELRSAIANMPRQAARADQPSQLLRGKIERAKQTGVLA